MITAILNKISVIILFLVSVSSAFCAEDTFEPNNSYLEAKEIDFNQPYPVSIFPQKDYDYFKIKTSEAGYLQVKSENLPKAVEFGFRVSFYNSQGEQVPTDYEDNACKVSAGEYFFAVYNEYRYAAQELFNITAIFIKEMDKFEVNDALETARIINFNNPYSVAIFPKRDYDYFKVRVAEPGYIQINFEKLPQKIESGLRVDFFNSAKEKIPSKYDDTAARVLPGEYFFSLYNEYRYSAQDLFHIKTDFLKEKDKFEPNDSLDFAKDIALDKEFNLVLFPKNDVDFFKIKTVSGGILSVNLSKPQDDVDLTMDFYNAEKKQIASDTNEALVEANSIYYVAIRPLYGYKFSVEPVSFIANVRENEDVYEPNNSFQTARQLQIPSTIKITVYPKGDVDYFKFEIKEDGYLTELISNYDVSTLGKQFYEEILIDVYNRDKKKIDSFENKWAKNNIFKRFSELKPGAYYLEIKGERSRRELFDINFDFISKKDFNSALPENKKRKDFSFFILGLGMKKDLSAQIDAKILANTLGGELILVENKGQIERAMTKAIRKAKGEKENAFSWVVWILLIAFGVFVFFKYFRRKKK